MEGALDSSRIGESPITVKGILSVRPLEPARICPPLADKRSLTMFARRGGPDDQREKQNYNRPAHAASAVMHVPGAVSGDLAFFSDGDLHNFKERLGMSMNMQ